MLKLTQPPRTSHVLGLTSLALLVIGVGCASTEGAERSAEPAPEDAPAETAPASVDDAPAESGEAATGAAPSGASLDLSTLGERFAGMSLVAPEGASATKAFGTAEIKAGEGFQLEISPGGDGFEDYKSEIVANDVNVLKGFVVEEPNAILYQSESMPGAPEFHLLVMRGGEDKGSTCQDTKGPTYTLEQAKRMLAACQSISMN